MSNFKSIGLGVLGLRVPKIGGLPLTLIVAITTVLRTNVLHCDNIEVKLSEQITNEWVSKVKLSEQITNEWVSKWNEADVFL